MAKGLAAPLPKSKRKLSNGGRSDASGISRPSWSMTFARGLASKGATEVRVTRPKNAFAITAADSSAEGARVSVVRPLPLPTATADVIAETAEGASIASKRLTFDTGSTTAEALFAIPAAALNRVARFRIAGSPSADKPDF